MKNIELNDNSLAKPSYWQQFAIAQLSGLLAVTLGELFGWPAPAIPKLIAGDLGFPVSKDETATMTLISPFGYIIGCPLASLLLDRIGRKKTHLVIAIPQIIAWILIATSTCIEMIYVSRFISGIGESALFISVPVYLAEISDPKIRGKLVATFSLDMILGTFLINCYGSYLSIRTAAYVSLAVPILFVLTFIWMPESPYYLLMKKQKDEAKKSLQTLRRTKEVDAELNQLLLDVERQISESSTIKDIFTIKYNFKAMLIVLGLRTLQQYAGISAIGVYIQVIFQQVKSEVSPAVASILFSLVHMLTICVGSVLVDKFGRRSMALLSSAGTALVLFIEGLYFYLQHLKVDLSYFSWLPLLGIILYVFILYIGIGILPNLMAGELFSANVKARALGMNTLYYAVLMGTTYKLFQLLENSFGMHMPFFFFSACCFVGVIFCYYCVPETKGKTLEEIQQLLKGHVQKEDEENVTKVP